MKLKIKFQKKYCLNFSKGWAKLIKRVSQDCLHILSKQNFLFLNNTLETSLNLPDNVFVGKVTDLFEKGDFTDCREWHSFFAVYNSNSLECHESSFVLKIPGFVDNTVRTITDLSHFFVFFGHHGSYIDTIRKPNFTFLLSEPCSSQRDMAKILLHQKTLCRVKCVHTLVSNLPGRFSIPSRFSVSVRCLWAEESNSTVR